jgi:hypothetical protein
MTSRHCVIPGLHDGDEIIRADQVLEAMAAVLAEFLAGALGSVTTKVFVFPFETVRVILAVRKDEFKVRHTQRDERESTTPLRGWVRTRAAGRWCRRLVAAVPATAGFSTTGQPITLFRRKNHVFTADFAGKRANCRATRSTAAPADCALHHD